MSSATSSSAPVTVTVFTVFLSLELKLRLSETLNSSESFKPRLTVTLLTGSEFNFTVKVEVVPASLTATLSAETTRLAVSSSVSVMVCWVALSVAPLPPVTLEISTLIVSVPSVTLSSTPVSVAFADKLPAAIVSVLLLRV